MVVVLFLLLCGEGEVCFFGERSRGFCFFGREREGGRVVVVERQKGGGGGGALQPLHSTRLDSTPCHAVPHRTVPYRTMPAPFFLPLPFRSLSSPCLLFLVTLVLSSLSLSHFWGQVRSYKKCKKANQFDEM